MEYSIKFYATFHSPCRNFESKTGGDFRGMPCEFIFTTIGYRHWKHSTVMNSGFSKHDATKEHLACYSTWKEKIKRSEMGKEITSLVNTEELKEIATIFLPN